MDWINWIKCLLLLEQYPAHVAAQIIVATILMLLLAVILALYLIAYLYLLWRWRRGGSG